MILTFFSTFFYFSWRILLSVPFRKHSQRSNEPGTKDNQSFGSQIAIAIIIHHGYSNFVIQNAEISFSQQVCFDLDDLLRKYTVGNTEFL